MPSSFLIRLNVCGVDVTRLTIGRPPPRIIKKACTKYAVHALPSTFQFASEEAECLRAVTDQHVLRLLIVIEHHLVRLAADARLLVATERGVRRISVVAVGPHAAGLD